MSPRSAQSSLSHWSTWRPGHGRGLERHDVVETAGGDDHAARVLAEMARQPLDAADEIDQEPDARRVGVDAAVAELRRQLVVLVVPAVLAEQLREPVDLIEAEAERLADLAHGAARAVADDGRGHGGAARAVAPVDVLDHLFAPVARRQVEVDVGPLAALLGEEALEEELHRHGVDRRDAERIADGAVRGRAASLTEDATLATEADDVPDDEEVAGEVELGDDGQLVLELPAHAVGDRPPTLARAGLRELAQVALRRLAGLQRIVGKAIGQVGERERTALGDAPAFADPCRRVAEERRHLFCRPEMTLGIRQQAASGLVDRRAEPDAGEDVEQRAVGRHGVSDVVGRDHGDVVRVGQVGESPRPACARAVAMVVHVDRESIGEDTLEAIEPCRRAGRIDERALVAAGETEKPRRVRRDLVPRDAPVALRTAERARREQPAEVRVPDTILHQEVQRARVLHDDVGADDRAHPCRLRGLEEPRRAVEPVPVRERNGVVAERRGARRRGLRATRPRRGRRTRFGSAARRSRRQASGHRMHRIGHCDAVAWSIRFCSMRSAGLREVREHLSMLLDEVGKGREVLITDRGRPVARLVPAAVSKPSGKPFRSLKRLRDRVKMKGRRPLSQDLEDERADRF